MVVKDMTGSEKEMYIFTIALAYSGTMRGFVSRILISSLLPETCYRDCLYDANGSLIASLREPRVLPLSTVGATAANFLRRQDLQTQLDQVIDRLAVLTPRYYSPPIGLDDKSAERAAEEHKQIRSEKKELEQRRNYLMRSLETGIDGLDIRILA
jgi:hypothetical protein